MKKALVQASIGASFTALVVCAFLFPTITEVWLSIGVGLTVLLLMRRGEEQ